MPQMITLRKHLNGDAMINEISDEFLKIEDTRADNVSYSVHDALMSAFAMFSIKSESLLDFQENREDDVVWSNIKNTFHCSDVPKESQMRNILDTIDPMDIRSPFKSIFSQVQRGKALEEMAYLNGYYLLAIDGCEIYKSTYRFNDTCMVRNPKHGDTEYYQQFLAGSIVHPFKKEVIPLCPEMILKQDGSEKNDSERNASRRFLSHYRREHPHLKTIVLEDAMSANAPHIKTLNEKNCRFIINIKPKGNKFIFKQIKKLESESSNKVHEFENIETVTLNPKGQTMKVPNTMIQKYKFVNDISLNAFHKDVKVNALIYAEYDVKRDKTTHFSWVTDLEITDENVVEIMRAGRARWRIENETFNVLVNLGYNLKHNFGLGKKHLSTNFIQLMMLAFLVDQIQQLCCPLFQAVLLKKRKKRLWRKMRAMFSILDICSIEEMLNAIVYGMQKEKRPTILHV